MGVIERAHTKWISPIVFAPRKDITLQFRVYYSKLNAVTIQGSYPDAIHGRMYWFAWWLDDTFNIAW